MAKFFTLVVLLIFGTASCDTWYEMTVRSMEPTIEIGADIRVDENFYQQNPIERFDIVTFKTPEGYIQTKRIIGLPNEKLAIIEGSIFVDDKILEEPIKFDSIGEDHKEIHIPEDHYFILGDNRNRSRDSRYWGTFPIESIEGKVVEVRNP